MRIYLLFIFSLLNLSFGCKPNNTPITANPVNDLTKFHKLDSLTTPNYLMRKEFQDSYNNGKLRAQKELLKELKIGSLKDLKSDISAYRLIASFGWRNDWSGVPLVLTIYNTPDTLAVVETFELNPVNRREEYYENSVWQHLRYKVKKENFFELEKNIKENGYWTAYSFEENDGWGIFDNDVYFIELRSGNNYKLIVRELGDNLEKKNDILVPFLLATRFNDTVAHNIQEYWPKVREELIKRRLKDKSKGRFNH